MPERHSPFIFTAIVIAISLVLGVALVIFAIDIVPALVVSVVLSCGVATLIYGILGGVTRAGFDLGPIKMGGSAAVLLGGVWFFNYLLEPQLERIRRETRIERFSFDFDEHADPSSGWFAVDERTGKPVEISFVDPVTGNAVETVEIPSPSAWIGGSIEMKPATVYGFRRLYISRGDELPIGMERRWGNTECRGESMPFEIEAVRFENEFTFYDLRRCDTTQRAKADHSSALQSHRAELVELEIEGNERSFVIAVLAVDHRSSSDLNSPPWSTFLVIEMESSK